MKRILGLALLILAWWATGGTAWAIVKSQCPDYVQGVSVDANGDGMLRGTEISPTTPDNQVCIHLSSGDGFFNMADTTINPTIAASPGGDQTRGEETYLFGFSNVTGIADADVGAIGILGAVFPAPSIKLREGDEVYLSLTNVGMAMRPDLFDPHTVHWHGFPNASAIFDGVPDNSISIMMGSTLTYYYNVVDPGTFMYHCHVEAAEHMQMGMLGNLYVYPAQDDLPDGTDLNGFTHQTGFTYAYNDGDGSTRYDVEYPIQIHGVDPVFHDADLTIKPLPFADMDDKYPMLNGRGYPETVNTDVLYNSFNDRPTQPMHALITATQGERVLLRVSSLSTTSFHTLTVMGIPMQVVGNGSRQLNNPYTANTIRLGGGESIDVILDTQDIAPGTYFLYTTNVDHLNNNEEPYGGMMTEIVIQPGA